MQKRKNFVNYLKLIFTKRQFRICVHKKKIKNNINVYIKSLEI